MKKLNVIFQSVWAEGVINSDAKFDVINNKIDNIKKSKDGAEYEILIQEFIIYDNELYALELSTDNEYYLNDKIFTEFKMNNPVIVSEYNLTY